MNNLPKRKSNRLKNHDYCDGMYFITICTENKKCLFSKVVGADTIRPNIIELTKYGEIVETAINNIPTIYPSCFVDKYVIMPNHIHLILSINNTGGRMISAPTVIAQFKRYVTKTAGITIWQKGFYDHIIRDDEDYITKAQYIENNPAKWQEDKYYCK